MLLKGQPSRENTEVGRVFSMILMLKDFFFFFKAPTEQTRTAKKII